MKQSWGDCFCGEDNIIRYSDGSVETCMQCNGYEQYEKRQILMRKPFSAWDYSEKQHAPIISMDLYRMLCEDKGTLPTRQEQIDFAKKFEVKKLHQGKNPDDAA